MKTISIRFAALLAIALLAAPGITFAKKNKSGGPPGFSGWVTAVDTAANSITVAPTKKLGGDPKTFTVTSTTKITVDGKPGKLADIKTRMKAGLTLGNPATTAVSITAVTHAKRAKAEDASSPAPAATPQK